MTQSNPQVSPPSINPYKVGLGLIARRLLWDINPLSWKYRKRLQSLRNTHQDQKAIILCNGPSLNDVDLDSLGDIYTFGLNKINLIFEYTTFRPSSIISVNPLVISQNADFFSRTSIPTFLDTSAKKLLRKISPSTTLLHSTDYPYFSRDCSLSLFQGYTVTFVALQLAYHMGFKQVALVGCDHEFVDKGIPNQLTSNEAIDRNHFSENYFRQGEPWQLPDLKGSEYSYELAHRAYQADGRRIINASTHSKLDNFPKKNLKSFLDD